MPPFSVPKYDCAWASVGEQSGRAVCGQPERERHPRFLAHARRPEGEGRQEEDQQRVAAVVALGYGDAEGPVEEIEAPEAQPGEHEEATNAGHASHRVDE